MSREWKPGTVLTSDSGNVFYAVEITENTVAAGRLGRAWTDGAHVIRADGNGYSPDLVAGLRPLVVIDPEDREQVERFREIASRLADFVDYDADASAYTEAMQAALREFANPTPPKPDEPTGLGAVVEDAEGVLWIRADGDKMPWLNAESSGDYWQPYVDIAAVRVLSEGVQP